MTIGVFDSGAGGLTVLRALKQRFPRCDFIYLADTARFPYGTKSAEDIHTYTREGIQFLIDSGAESIVVACNTASAYLQPTPAVVGVIEPILRACEPYSSIGVIGTKATVASGVFQRALGCRCRFALPCSGLIQLAEAGCWDEKIAKRELQPLIGKVDALILGCTHYGLIRDEIQAVVGEVPLVGAETIAIERAAKGSGAISYYVTGDPDRFHHQIPPPMRTTAPIKVNVRNGISRPSTTCTSTSR